MARVNPMILPRPTRQVVYRQITDGRNVADFWLRARDATEDFQGLELIKEKVKLYITGDRQKDKDPVPFPPVGGEAVVKLSEALFQAVGSIYVMQSDVDEHGQPVMDAPYSFEELVGMTLTLPTMWNLLLDFGAEVDQANEAAQKNA